jgi:hypothetical protein
MPRTLYRLTDRIVRNLKTPGYHADGGGLYLQISKAGTKSWVLRFRIHGRTRDMGLGAFANVSLTDARTHAAELRPLIARGVDPIERAKAARASTTATPTETPRELTFRVFAEKYIDDHAPEWRSAKHADQWRATLKRHVYPFIATCLWRRSILPTSFAHWSPSGATDPKPPPGYEAASSGCSQQQPSAG